MKEVTAAIITKGTDVLISRRALEIYEKALGPDHPRVATGLKNLAALYHETNQGREAERLEKRAVRIRAISR